MRPAEHLPAFGAEGDPPPEGRDGDGGRPPDADGIQSVRLCQVEGLATRGIVPIFRLRRGRQLRYSFPWPIQDSGAWMHPRLASEGGRGTEGRCGGVKCQR